MATSKAVTVEEYLAELPEERRGVIARVRNVVKKNLPEGYRETMGYGMITWEIPLSEYPDTYNGKPLAVAGLAAQKNYSSLYLLGAYADPVQTKALQDGFKAAGKKLDMGQSCVRFKTSDDLPLDVIADVVASMPPARLIEITEKAHSGRRKKKAR